MKEYPSLPLLLCVVSGFNCPVTRKSKMTIKAPSLVTLRNKINSTKEGMSHSSKGC